MIQDDDIVEAINHLNILCGEVNETFEVTEDIMRGIGKGLVGGLAAYGAYKGGKWLKKKWDARRAKQKGLKSDAEKHRKNVEYMKDKKPGDTIKVKRPRTEPRPDEGRSARAKEPLPKPTATETKPLERTLPKVIKKSKVGGVHLPSPADTERYGRK